LAQHRFETQNSIRFNGTSILGQQDTWTIWPRKSSQTSCTPETNRVRGLNLSQSWCLLTDMIKQYRDIPGWRQDQA
jgi:hypothetical protein